MKILITAGANREYVDKVRFLTNTSTGTTGSLIADSLSGLGHEIYFLHGEGSRLPSKNTKLQSFGNFKDLDQKLHSLLSRETFGAIIHLAAVSDYSIDRILEGDKPIATSAKLSSGLDLKIKLVPNYKILNRLKSYCTNSPVVIGFKLTGGDSSEVKASKIKSIFDLGSVDYVVHNDLSEIQGPTQHRFYLHSPSELIKVCENVSEVSRSLNYLIAAIDRKASYQTEAV